MLILHVESPFNTWWEHIREESGLLIYVVPKFFGVVDNG